MSNKFVDENLYSSIKEKLNALKGKELTEQDKQMLLNIHKEAGRLVGCSEHFKWCFELVVKKFNSMADMLSGAEPYEVVRHAQNIVLDAGREEIVKLLTGTGGTEYNNANAKIYVGDNSTPENANQTGIVATTNRAYANMVSGFPTTNGGQATFRGLLDGDTANFDVQEIAITNGTGVGSIALNRRVVDLGRKASGTTWEVSGTITMLSV